MFALLGETPELAEKTLEFAKSLPVDFASFHLTTPFPGTELWRDFSSWGKLENDFSKFTQLNPVFVLYAWNNKEDELQEMLGKAFREFYLRPKYIIDQFLKICSIADVKLYCNGLRSLCRVKKEIEEKILLWLGNLAIIIVLLIFGWAMVFLRISFVLGILFVMILVTIALLIVIK